MLNELREAFRAREAARALLTKLEGLARAGEVSMEEARQLASDYQDRIRKAEAEITALREQLRARLDTVVPVLEAYDEQVRRLEREAEEGRLSGRRYQKEVARVLDQRAAFANREQVALIEALMRAGNTQALEGLSEISAEAQPGPRSRAVWDTVLRGASLVVALAILVASGLPFFSVHVVSVSEAGDSLVRAAYNGFERSPFLAYLAIVPVVLAMGMGFTFVTRSRKARAMILFTLATVAASFGAVLTGAAFSYPSPTLSGVRTMLYQLGKSEAGLMLLIACVLCMYGLGIMSLSSVRRRISACAWTLGIPLVVGLCVWAYFYLTVQVSASLVLNAKPAEQQEQSRDIDVEVLVTNEGTVPIYVENNISNLISRSQFALNIEQQPNTADEWHRGGVQLLALRDYVMGEDLGEGSERILAKGELRFSGRLSGGELASRVALRGILSNQDGAEIMSESVTVDLPEPPPTPVEPLTTPMPTTEVESRPFSPDAKLAAKEREASQLMDSADKAYQNKTYDSAANFAQKVVEILGDVETSTGTALRARATELETRATQAADLVRKLEELKQHLTQAKASTAEPLLREIREAILKIEPASERDSFNQEVDAAIFSAKQREASDRLQEANEAFKNESYDHAAKLAQEALDVFTHEPLTPTVDAASSPPPVCGDASMLIETAKRAVDPTLRFALTGIIQVDKGNTAFLNDTITGENFRVAEGDRVKQWKVDEITTKTIVLEKDGQTWELIAKRH